MQLKLYKSKAINQTENKYVMSNMISIINWTKIFYIYGQQTFVLFTD